MVYHQHQDGSEYLACLRHHNEHFRPAAVVARPPGNTPGNAFTPSRAKDDSTDAELALDLLVRHPERLAPLKPQSVGMRTLVCLVEQRRNWSMTRPASPIDCAAR